MVILAVGGSFAATAQTPSAALNGSFYGSDLSDPAQGKLVVELKCASCHGSNGNSDDEQFPKLAGQKFNYLYQQASAFKAGTRHSDVMAGVVGELSAVELADAAAFYSRQGRMADSVEHSRVTAIGQEVYFRGNRATMTPPCVMCHGAPNQTNRSMMMPMMGMTGFNMADVPNLDGQHAKYVVGELNRFASGERLATVMNRIAAGLSEADREAVAEFIAGAP